MLDFVVSPLFRLKGIARDITGIHYRPPGIGLGDCCFATDENGFHCFYITRRRDLKRDCGAPGQETAIGHGMGKGIGDMAPAVDAIVCETGHVWAPSVVYGFGKWHMFYTAVTDKLYQTINAAYSEDLLSWKKPQNNTVIDCGDFGWAAVDPNGYTDCRDPYVTEYDGTWYTYYTARLQNGDACIGVSASEDLEAWIDRGYCLHQPYNRGAGTEICESPCAFRKNGLYYLVYNQGLDIRYAVSDNPTDFSRSPVKVLCNGTLPDRVPYNFELLDADTGLFGYLCGGYFSYAGFGYCDIDTNAERLIWGKNAGL